jgi:hypothetical protein
MTSGQEWDKSDTQKMTISNKLSARYQRRCCAVDRWSLATPPGAQYDGTEYEALPVNPVIPVCSNVIRASSVVW